VANPTRSINRPHRRRGELFTRFDIGERASKSFGAGVKPRFGMPRFEHADRGCRQPPSCCGALEIDR
jgi:hypothetical protein